VVSRRRGEPWRGLAACATADPEMFFPSDSSRPLAALSICASCPVLEECAEFCEKIEDSTTSVSRIFGIWGGETPADRVARRRAAKRK